MGFLDYLRELRQDEFPFPRGHRIVVEGLEDVLLAAGDPWPKWRTEFAAYSLQELTNSNQYGNQRPGNV